MVAERERTSEECERPVPIRLQKFLARAGVASRRGSEDLMTAGRVRVNGEVVTELGSKVTPGRDEVTVDGQVVVFGTACAYYALNKPAGYVTTMSDPQGRPTVAELLPEDAPAGTFPIGRLDVETTGLLLLTTDGELAFRLMHPRFHVPKTYIANVRGMLTEREAERLREGIELDDGPTKPAEVRILRADSRGSRAEIVIREGRKRQVRRMFFDIRHPVIRLERVRFGPVELGDLRPGRLRPLSEPELVELRRETGLTEEKES